MSWIVLPSYVYSRKDSREAEGFIERANLAVIMSTVKVILSHMELIAAANTDTIYNLTRKLAPPPVKF